MQPGLYLHSRMREDATLPFCLALLNAIGSYGSVKILYFIPKVSYLAQPASILFGIMGAEMNMLVASLMVLG
jgi:hypothetical protein